MRGGSNGAVISSSINSSIFFAIDVRVAFAMGHPVTCFNPTKLNRMIRTVVGRCLATEYTMYVISLSRCIGTYFYTSGKSLTTDTHHSWLHTLLHTCILMATSDFLKQISWYSQGPSVQCHHESILRYSDGFLPLVSLEVLS